MTVVGMCGVFIPDRFRQAGRGTNGKGSTGLGGGYVRVGGGRGKYVCCVCGWDYCIDPVETSAIRNQTPGKHPKENILHVKHGESLKTRNLT
jgi:hypothetical protein